MIADDQQISEVESLRKDWYERVYNALEKFDDRLNDLSKQVSELRDELKEYAKSSDDKIEEKLLGKIEDLGSKITKAEERKEEINRSGKRWLIGTVLILLLSAMGTVGGYFITTAVLSTKVTVVEAAHKELGDWQKLHHDKIEGANTASDRNTTDIYELREDFRTYIKDSKEEEGP